MFNHQHAAKATLPALQLRRTKRRENKSEAEAAGKGKVCNMFSLWCD